jgi:hypothetical protein
MKVISGFPGVGKTYYKNNSIYSLKVTDSDSSKFSWVKEGVRHPDFPQNYINHIKTLHEYRFVFVSSHDVVRRALVDNNIYFTLVFPERNLKEEYLNRFKNRGSNKNFTNLLDTNCNIFIDSMENQTNCDLIRLGPGEFLKDYLDENYIM